MIHTAKDAYKWQLRQEVIKDACNSYGWGSRECQQITDIYEEQYAASKIGQLGSDISSFFIKIAIAILILFWISTKIIKLYYPRKQ